MITGSHSHPIGDSGLAHYLLYLALVPLAILLHIDHCISSKEKGDITWWGQIAMRKRKAKGDLCVKLDLIDWLHVDNKTDQANWKNKK
jgi:hypothetical protein